MWILFIKIIITMFVVQIEDSRVLVQSVLGKFGHEERHVALKLLKNPFYFRLTRPDCILYLEISLMNKRILTFRNN